MSVVVPLPQGPYRNEGFHACLRTEPDALCVAFYGELDLMAADEAMAAIRRAAAHDGTVVVDLSGLAFMDSTGLHLMLRAVQLIGERLLVLPGPRHVHRTFEITGIDALLPFAR